MQDGECDFCLMPYCYCLAKNSYLQHLHLAMPPQVTEIKECAITLPNCCALKKTFLFNTLIGLIKSLLGHINIGFYYANGTHD